MRRSDGPSLFLYSKSRLLEKLEHRADCDATEQKEQQKEKGKTPTAAGLRAKLEGDRQTTDVVNDEP